MRTRGLTKASSVCIVAAAIVAIGGCASRQKPAQLIRPPTPVESEGFRFQFQSMITTTTVNYRTGEVDRRLTLVGEVSDTKGGQVATVGHAIQLDDVRDERGRDLIAQATQTHARRVDDQDARFPYFFDAITLESGGRFVYNSSAMFTGLLDSPKCLSTLRGKVGVLVATRLSKHDLPVEPTQEWRELSPGLSIRITKVEGDDRPTDVRFQMRTVARGMIPNEAEWRRWYNLEQLDADGKRITQQAGIAGAYDTTSGIGEGRLSSYIGPPAPPVKTLRITVIDEIESIVIPFEYHDIQLQ